MKKWKKLLVFCVLVVVTTTPVVSASTIHRKWAGYTVYNTPHNNETNWVTTIIDSDELGFALDNKHITVEYKSNVFGWYINIGDSVSKDVWYNFIDHDTYYEVKVVFSNESKLNDVRISCFPGCDSENWYNKDSVMGNINHFFVGSFSTLRKAFVSLWNW